MWHFDGCSVPSWPSVTKEDKSTLQKREINIFRENLTTYHLATSHTSIPATICGEREVSGWLTHNRAMLTFTMYYTYRSYCVASEHRGCNRRFLAQETCIQHGCRAHFFFSVKLPYFNSRVSKHWPSDSKHASRLLKIFPNMQENSSLEIWIISLWKRPFNSCNCNGISLDFLFFS